VGNFPCRGQEAPQRALAKCRQNTARLSTVRRQSGYHDAITSERFGCVVLSSLICAAAISIGTAQNLPADRPFGDHASFRLDKAKLRATPAAAALLDGLAENPYLYFRMLAPQYSARTCFEFRDLRWRLPSAGVHGDPHVEQFVTTANSYGLEDFDLAGFGPAVVDLVRYAASIHVACRQATWSCNPDEAVANYFNAYHAALDHPVARKQPGVVARLRAAAPIDQLDWLQWATSLMRPLPGAQEQEFRRGWQRFVQLMRDAYPDRPETFFHIERLGALQIGVGSGLEAKILIRIAGPTVGADDDVILEVRPTRTSDGTECVSRPTHGGSMQVMMFEALLGPRLPKVVGFLPREGAREAPELWVQSWDPGYRELSIANLQSQTELNELALDAATQLAGYFWTTFPEPLRPHQRFAQLRAFELTGARAQLAAREFAGETITEWERFRRAPK
jgi:hypothetical protein